MAIGERIRAARGDQTQEQFASALGVSDRAVQYWEAGKRKPSMEQFEKLVRVTGHPASFFLDEQKEAIA